MKTIYIPAKSKSKLDKSVVNEISKKLPTNMAIAYSIQYKSQAEELRKIFKPRMFTQVLGCSRPKFPKSTKAVLLISDGRFHATSLALESGLPVYLLENNKLSKISDKDIEILKKRKKSSYVKFLNSNQVGIIISAKPGQQRLGRALELKKKLNARQSKILGATKSRAARTRRRRGEDFVGNKHSYLFICNNIQASEFENFPDIQIWVNTACPRMDMNNVGVVNLSDLS